VRGLWCMVRGAWSIVPRKPMPENDRRTQLFSIINKKSQRLDGRSQNRRAALGRRRSWNRFAALGRGRPRPKAGYHSRTPRVAPKKRINTGKTGGSRKIPSRPSVDGRSRNRLAALGRRRSRNRFAALGRGRPQPKAGYHSRIPRGAKKEKRRGREGSRKIPSRPLVDGRSRNRLAALGRRRSRVASRLSGGAALGRRLDITAGPQGRRKKKKNTGEDGRAHERYLQGLWSTVARGIA
jgi:hypothetical protein